MRKTVGKRLQAWDAGSQDDDKGSGQPGSWKKSSVIARRDSFSRLDLLDGGEGEQKRWQYVGYLREGAESKHNRSWRVPMAVTWWESTSVEALAANSEQRRATSPFW